MDVITEYLDKHKISQANFGKEIGVNQTMVSAWLAKRRGISLDKAFAIERVYGIDATLLNDQILIIEKQLKDRRKRRQKASGAEA